MGRLYDAFVEVGPRFTGFGDIKRQGDKAGREYGKALTDAAEKAAKANVRRLGEALAKARQGEADAVGSVRAAEAKLSATRGAASTALNKVTSAEAKLAELRAKGAPAKATAAAEAALQRARDGSASATARAVSAEEAVAKAQRKAATSANTAKDAADALDKARDRVSKTADAAGTTSGNRFSRAFKGGLSKMGGDREGKAFATRFGLGMNGAIGGIVSKSAGIFAAGFAAVQGVQLFSGFIKDASESARVSRLTAAAIKSTGGAAKITADQVGDLATAISNKTGADDETIQSGSNLLLTFTNIRNEVGRGNDIFNQASAAVTDMAAALNNGEVSQDGVKAASIQLGKALNDPIKGVTALQKVGVAFTADQKEQIKTLVDSGKTMDAQKIILRELQKEFGGAAAAAADPFTRLKTVFGNLGEELGGYLLPYANKFATFVTTKLIPGVSGLVKLIVNGDFTKQFREAFNVQEDSGLVTFLLNARQVAVSTFKEIRGGLTAFGEAWKANDGDVTSSGFPGVMERLGYAARQTFGFFKTEVLPRLRDFGNYIKNTVLPIVTELVQDRLQKMGQMFGTIRDAIKDNGPELTNLGGSLKSLGKFLIETVLPTFEKLSNNVFPQVGAGASTIIRVVGALVTAFTATKGAISTAFSAVQGAVSTAIGAVSGAISTAFNAVKSALGTAISAVSGAVGAVVGAVTGAFTTAVNFIKTTWGTIVSAVSGPLDAAIGVLQAIWSRVSPILVLPFYIAKDTIAKIFSGIQVIFSTVSGWVARVFAKAWSAVSGVLSGPINAGLHAIRTAWNGITSAFSTAKGWATGAFSKSWSAVKTVVSVPVTAAKTALDGIWARIKATFIAVKDYAVGGFARSWAALKTIILTPINLAKQGLATILGAGKGGVRWVFSQAVSAISAIWNRLQGLAKAPIRFIINTVLNNGLIGGFNWIAGKFDAPKIPAIPLPKGFAQGGRIPGAPSDVDNTWGFHNGGAIPLATGEFIVNARQTAKNLPLLKAINAGEEGFADGGVLGKLKGAVSSAYSKGKSFVGDVADFTKDPGSWLKNRFAGPLGKMDQLGNSTVAKIVTAVPRKLADALVGKAKDLLKGVFGGGPNIPVGSVVNFRGEKLNQRTIAMLLNAEAMLSRTFHIMQGSYSTRVSASGSTHAGGGAMDTDNAGAGWDAAVRALRAAGFAAWHRTPAQGPWGHHIHSIAIGDPSASPAAKGQVRDFLSGGDGLGGMARGGQIGVYDRGGRWPSGTLGINTSGKTETVIPGDGTLRLHPDDIRALAAALAAAPITLDGRRVDDAMSRRALNY